MGLLYSAQRGGNEVEKAEGHSLDLGRITTHSLRHLAEKQFFFLSLVIKPITFFKIATHNYNVTPLFSHKIKAFCMACTFVFSTEAFKCQIRRDEPNFSVFTDI